MSYYGINIEPNYSDICAYRRCPQTVAEIIEKIPGFILLNSLGGFLSFGL